VFIGFALARRPPAMETSPPFASFSDGHPRTHGATSRRRTGRGEEDQHLAFAGTAAPAARRTAAPASRRTAALHVDNRILPQLRPHIWLWDLCQKSPVPSGRSGPARSSRPSADQLSVKDRSVRSGWTRSESGVRSFVFLGPSTARSCREHGQPARADLERGARGGDDPGVDRGEGSGPRTRRSVGWADGRRVSRRPRRHFSDPV
jgi:hypothetical protein